MVFLLFLNVLEDNFFGRYIISFGIGFFEVGGEEFKEWIRSVSCENISNKNCYWEVVLVCNVEFCFLW